MLKYFIAENLKIKNSFLNKFIFIMPILTVILALLLEPTDFQSACYNSWYALILPGTAILTFSLLSRIDGKMHNRSVLALPIDLKKIWLAKILVGMKSIFISCIIIFFSAQLAPIIDSSTFESIIPLFNGLIAIIILVITLAWQIPLFMFLQHKIGIFLTIAIGILLNFLSLIVSVKNFWWLIPFSYPSRLMCPILKILPNGLPAKPGSKTFTPELLNNINIPIGLILSIAIFFIVTYITSNWYKQQEV